MARDRPGNIWRRSGLFPGTKAWSGGRARLATATCVPGQLGTFVPARRTRFAEKLGPCTLDATRDDHRLVLIEYPVSVFASPRHFFALSSRRTCTLAGSSQPGRQGQSHGETKSCRRRRRSRGRAPIRAQLRRNAGKTQLSGHDAHC